jgi:hypothetical protein
VTVAARNGRQRPVADGRSHEIGHVGSPIVGLGHNDGRQGSNGLNRSQIQIVQNKFKCFKILTNQKSTFPCSKKLK